MFRTEVRSREEAVDELSQLTDEERRKCLLLSKHPEYPTYFYVDSFNPTYIHDLYDVIGPWRALSMLKLDSLWELARNREYERAIFLDDPSDDLDRVSHLDDPYPLGLTVDLRAFQTQGFNFTKNLNADIINWSTGTGKSVLAIAKAKYLLENDLVDKVIVASRNHNRINWKRQFAKIGNLDSEVADASGKDAQTKREARQQVYKDNRIIILNYEKFRFQERDHQGNTKIGGDGVELLQVLKKKRVYFIYDEMPTKLKNPNTATYKGLKKILRGCKETYQSMLSAIPVENSPEDVYWCIKLMDKDVLNMTVKEFRGRYGKYFNRYAKWKVKTWDREALGELGMRLAHMTHRADKYKDPEIQAQFPQEHWEDIIIDMSDQDRKIYKWVEDLVKRNPMTAIQDPHVLQIICNNPAWLKLSKSELSNMTVEHFNPTAVHANKLEILREMLEQIDGKVVLFSAYNNLGARPLSKYLEEWKFTHVLYDGEQEALDKFRENKRVKVFLSSDMGSDSINLPEATTVINFDLPWKYTTLIQRVNRVNRIDSEFDHVFYYNLLMANTMEERKLEVISQKGDYDTSIFGFDIADQSDIMSDISTEDIWYILTGEKA